MSDSIQYVFRQMCTYSIHELFPDFVFILIVIQTPSDDCHFGSRSLHEPFVADVQRSYYSAFCMGYDASRTVLAKEGRSQIIVYLEHAC